MEYTENNWEMSKKQGDIAQAIQKIKEEIAVNLFNIHNEYSSNKLEKVQDVFDLMNYDNDVSELKVFYRILTYFIGQESCEQDMYSDIELLSEYERIQITLKNAIKCND